MATLVCLEGSARALAFANAVEREEIQRTSSFGTLQRLLNIQQGRLRLYQEVLVESSDRSTLIATIRASAETLNQMVARQPLVEVAWTYPGIARPGLRTTGGVAREMISQTKRTLLIVGYALSVDASRSGLASQTIDAVAQAAERGVAVTAVLHRTANRNALLQAWRPGVQLPSIFTWPESDDAMAAVHAKVLIADRIDALITSANLTYHGFERNLEMGIRVKGEVAAEIYDRLRDLINSRDLVPWT